MNIHAHSRGAAGYKTGFDVSCVPPVASERSSSGDLGVLDLGLLFGLGAVVLIVLAEAANLLDHGVREVAGGTCPEAYLLDVLLDGELLGGVCSRRCDADLEDGEVGQLHGLSLQGEFTDA